MDQEVYMTETAVQQPETAGPQAEPVPAADENKEKQAEVRKRQQIRRRRAAARRKGYHNLLLAGVFLLMVIVCFIVNLAVKDKDFSDTENRSLAGKPAFSWDSLTDGGYFAGLGDYVSDQFFWRDGWMSTKLRSDSLLGKKEAFGVYLGQEDYLIASPETPDKEALSRTVESINTFAQANPNLAVRVMVAPEAASVLADKLPENAPVRDQLQDVQNAVSRFINRVQFLDVSDALKAHSDSYIYYKTDHHWTSLGAYYAFSACAGQMGIESPAADYSIYTVTDSFEGTLASKSGSHRTTDSIQVYEPLGMDISYYVVYPDSTERVCSLYRSDCLENKDKYTVFFGGNYSKVEIETTADNDRRLLVFKDSYANCFMQFLTPYYNKIIMIDPRYYYDDLEPVLTSEGITDVLMLYSADTFVTDTSLADVLESVSRTAGPEAASETAPQETEQTPSSAPAEQASSESITAE